MSEQKPKRPAPLTVRLRPSVEERLRRDAALFGMTVNAYVNWIIENPGFPPPKAMTEEDRQMLAKICAFFGSSRIPNNMNQLARAANTQSLPVTPDTELALNTVCDEVREVCGWLRDYLTRRRSKR